MNAISVIEGDCSTAAATDPPATLLWTDPPYGTGRTQTQGGNKFNDSTDTSYVIEGLLHWLPLLDDNATVCICCDYRLAPKVTGAIQNEGWVYRGEIIWEFGLGRPRTSWWPVRHNNVLTFTKAPESGIFNPDAIPRAKRLAPKPGYTGDKPAGSVWEYTLSNTAPERVGYPNQKPVNLIRPFIQAHTNPGHMVVDPFCGSASTGVAAIQEGRRFVGYDTNPDAIMIANLRLNVAAASTTHTR